jgi:hypothetical protein
MNFRGVVKWEPKRFEITSIKRGAQHGRELGFIMYKRNIVGFSFLEKGTGLVGVGFEPRLTVQFC